ncbi:hypothetical protein BGZ98_001124 [Dissophora globulifera]|nr:hypothetical protein BGZ98_001124 [Dissophora globulifera]
MAAASFSTPDVSQHPLSAVSSASTSALLSKIDVAARSSVSLSSFSSATPSPTSSSAPWSSTTDSSNSSTEATSPLSDRAVMLSSAAALPLRGPQGLGLTEDNDKAERGRAGRRRSGSLRFKFPKKLLHLQQHQQSPQHYQSQQPSEQNEMQPPVSPQQQQNSPQSLYHQQQQWRHRESLKSGSINGTSQVSARLRRGFAYLQSHYHVFHRRTSNAMPTIPATNQSHIETHLQRHGGTAADVSVTTALPFPTSCDTGPGDSEGSTEVTSDDIRAHCAIQGPSSRSMRLEGSIPEDDPQKQWDSTATMTTASNDLMIQPIHGVGLSSHGVGPLSHGSRTSGRGPGGIMHALGLFSRVAASSNSSSLATSPTLFTTTPPTSCEATQSSTQAPSQEMTSRNQRFRGRQSSPKHISKVFEAGVRKMGLIKRRKRQNEEEIQPLPSHYFSLPVGVGGSASSATSGNYDLHSGDLSMTEFAKLAGITILPEDDEDTNYYDGDDSGNNDIGHAYNNMITATGGRPSVSASSSRSTGDESGYSDSKVGAGKITMSSSSVQESASRSRSGSAGNTLSSYGHLTSGSLASSRTHRRRTNIWDSQFWISPSHEAENLALPASASQSSLPSVLSADWARQRADIASQPSEIACINRANELGEADNTDLQSADVDENRRQPNTSGEHWSSNGKAPSSFEVDRIHTPPPIAVGPTKRSEPLSSAHKDAVELAVDLRRPWSFSSFTAVAIEMRSDRESQSSGSIINKGLTATRIPSNNRSGSSSQDHGPYHHNRNTTARTVPSLVVHQNTSEPALGTSGDSGGLKLTRSQRMAHSVALHALQPPKSRSSLSGGVYLRSHLRTRSVAGCSSARTRSPSPSPLSRQIEISDSEGFDSPQDEKDDFEFFGIPNSGFAPSAAAPVPSGQLQEKTPSPLSGNPHNVFAHEGLEEMGYRPVVRTSDYDNDFNGYAGSRYHQRTQSLPSMVLDSPSPLQSQQGQQSSPSPTMSSSRSPSLSHSSSPSTSSSQSTTSSQLTTPRRPSNSSPSRMFTPGTKVGRFTLVEERCTRHVDVQRAQQEQLLLTSQRRASMGDFVELSRGAQSRGGVLEDSSLTWSSNGQREQQRYHDQYREYQEQYREPGDDREGADWIDANPALQPSENVVIFQRKKTRRLQYLVSTSQPESTAMAQAVSRT